MVSALVSAGHGHELVNLSARRPEFAPRTWAERGAVEAPSVCYRYTSGSISYCISKKFTDVEIDEKSYLIFFSRTIVESVFDNIGNEFIVRDLDLNKPCLLAVTRPTTV